MTRRARPGNRTRFTLTYKDAEDGPQEQAELPLRMLVLGALTGRPSATPLAERRPTAITAGDFDQRMAEQDIALDLKVANELVSGADQGELGVSLKLRSLNDFTPDRIALQVPELNALVRLREALLALQAPLMDRARLRERLEELLRDETWRAAIARKTGVDPERTAS